MANVNPLLLVGAVIGIVTALLVLAYALIKDKKETMGFERTMNDGEILRRLAGYAKPYLAKFVVVLFLMLFSIAYDIISPLIVGALEELVSGEFELPRLFAGVAVYAGVLVFSMASTYFQAVILQRVGQRIISDLREDLFTHIESLSHEQLNEIPVGKLVTRVTNDTNAISMMFTNLLVTLTKNIFVILGILVAMLALNYELTLMVLCFVPFIVIFTVIFRKFSRRAYRKVKDATTDINTYLSENLSGIKVTQIFGRENEKMAEFREKSQRLARANREQIFVFGVFRPLVYMLYICSILCLFYLGGMGHLNGVTFLGQTITGGTIYMEAAGGLIDGKVEYEANGGTRVETEGATKNIVTMNGGEVRNLSGGRVNYYATGDAIANEVYVSDEVQIDYLVRGGSTYYGNANNNIVEMTGGTAGMGVEGGESGADLLIQTNKYHKKSNCTLILIMQPLELR